MGIQGGPRPPEWQRILWGVMFLAIVGVFVWFSLWNAIRVVKDSYPPP